MATLISIDEASFSPAEDAEAINKACKGWGADEKTLIRILGHRNASQRYQIKKTYQEMFHEDLIKRFESELSGDLEKAMYRWMLDSAERDAVLINVAMKKGTSEHHVIVEIACVLSSEELLQVRKAYQVRYKQSLEEDLASHTSGDIRKLLVGLVTAYRYNGDEVNARIADKEAEKLDEAMKNEEFNHEEVIRILTTRSKLQLMATLNRYRDVHGISISKALSSIKDNEFTKLLHTTIRCLNDHKKYYEKVLRNAVKRLGTDEDALSRAIVTRAEKDLEDIKQVYYKRNSVHLHHEVAKETHGDYKAFLLALLGNHN